MRLLCIKDVMTSQLGNVIYSDHPTAMWGKCQEKKYRNPELGVRKNNQYKFDRALNNRKQNQELNSEHQYWKKQSTKYQTST